MKIVVNKCYGGFGLSPIAIKEYLKLIGKECFFYERDYKTNIAHKVSNSNGVFSFSLTKDYGESIPYNHKSFENDYFYYGNIERTDENLIKVVETLGSKIASGQYAELEVVEIPDGIDYEIDEYDGIESIHEAHRSW